jgi:hypothetical protein
MWKMSEKTIEELRDMTKLAAAAGDYHCYFEYMSLLEAAVATFTEKKAAEKMADQNTQEK